MLTFLLVSSPGFQQLCLDRVLRSYSGPAEAAFAPACRSACRGLFAGLGAAVCCRRTPGLGRSLPRPVAPSPGSDPRFAAARSPSRIAPGSLYFTPGVQFVRCRRRTKQLLMLFIAEKKKRGETGLRQAAVPRPFIPKILFFPPEYFLRA